MKKTKLFKIVFLSLLSFALGLFFVACKSKDDGNNYLTLNKAEISIMLGETFVLEADFNVRDDAELSFTSKDESVVTVNNEGLLTTVALGQTEIVVRYGKDESVCKVKVENQGVVPYLDFVGDIEDTVVCYVGNGANLAATVSFNAKSYTDGEISYTSSAPAVAEVNAEGMLEAKTSGETQITLNAKWRGFEMSKTVKVQVADRVECCIDGGTVLAFKLGTIAQFRDQTYTVEKPIEITATVNGEDINEYTVSSLNEQVFKYENGKVIAVSAGASVLQVAFSVNEKEYVYSFDVSVEKPRFTYDKVVPLDDETSFPVLTVFEEEGEVIRAVDASGAQNVTVADNVIGGFTVNVSEPEPIHLVVETAKLVSDVRVMPCTKLIDDKEELKETFYSNNKTYSGYYMLNADIDVQNDTSIVDRGAAYFNGTFDGNGYSIKNLKYRWHGLLGLIKTDAVIKNVAFEDVLPVVGSSSYGGIGLIDGGAKVNFSNVYMSYATCSLDNSSSALNILSNGTGGIENYMNNVVIDISKVTLSNPYKVNLYAADLNAFWLNEGRETLYRRTNERWQNIYLISKSPLMYQPTNPVRILDADNRKEDTSYYNPADASVTKEKLTFEGVFRYDTVADFATAIAGANVSSFTESGYWKVDAQEGLLWK